MIGFKKFFAEWYFAHFSYGSFFMLYFAHQEQRLFVPPLYGEMHSAVSFATFDGGSLLSFRYISFASAV